MSEGLRLSRNAYDWLGDGVFFQDGQGRAHSWALERWPDAAVIEASIDLDNCMDLLDPQWFAQISESYDAVVSAYAADGRPLPRQHGLVHGLDRVVINYACDVLGRSGLHVSSVRGAFQEGRPAFPGSALDTLSHVQIAVRDLAAIRSLDVRYLGC